MKVRKAKSKTKRILAFGAWGICLAFLLVLVACGPTKLTLTRAHLTPDKIETLPHIFPQNLSSGAWEAEIRPDLKLKLQQQVYGFIPSDNTPIIVQQRTIDRQAFNGRATIEEITLEGTTHYGGKPVHSHPFNIVLVTLNTAPKASKPRPIIMMQSFCPNHNTIPHEGVSMPLTGGFSCEGDGVVSNAMSGVMTFVFGRYIATPPIEMILDHGYNFATMYPSELVLDSKDAGSAALNRLAKNHPNPDTRPGAIAVWAWGFSLARNALAQDPRFKDSPFIAYGHSRYGKSALLAGAFDENIDMVIAHQSGTGGASLSKNKKGESVAQITKSYPHWFAPIYAKFADRETDMSVDQHALLALIAPRPIMLGNARRDVWSDPNGAFRAAQAASPAYKLYNKQGLTATKLDQFNPDADIAFWLRPGTHGVVKEDWPAFLDFLDAHLK